MNDQLAWDKALAAARKSYSALEPATACALNNLIETIVHIKQQLVDLTTAAGSSQICRECRGECCRYGKYHVSVLDVLAYLKYSADLVVPDFAAHPDCPYSGIDGCTMPPGYRPMTCVVFNCQLVEDRLSTAEQETFRTQEQELRHAIRTAEQLTGMRLNRPFLLSIANGSSH